MRPFPLVAVAVCVVSAFSAAVLLASPDETTLASARPTSAGVAKPTSSNIDRVLPDQAAVASAAVAKSNFGTGGHVLSARVADESLPAAPTRAATLDLPQQSGSLEAGTIQSSDEIGKSTDWQEPASASHTGKVYGLFLGIDHYPMSPLPNCINDAKDMHDLMLRNGVPAQQLVLVPEQQCTRQGVLAALEQMANTAKAGDEVLIYFSGHGSSEQDTNGDEPDGADETWVTIDMKDIFDDDLDKAFSRIPGTVYVISDSCHSGTVSKDIEVDDDGFVAKYMSPAIKAKHRGEGEGGFRPRDTAVEDRRRQENRNSAGGCATPAGSIGVQQVRLFAACSDGEFSAASRRERNSAFTAELLAVLAQQRGQALQFGPVCQQITTRLRNRAQRNPQNPSLFQLDAQQSVPAWLSGGSGGVGATPQPAALAEAVREQMRRVVDGLLRREDSAAGARRDWIASFATASGQTTARTGDEYGIKLQVHRSAPRQVWLCVFNVGPTGNLTLLYPNGYDGNRAFGPGETLEIGCGQSGAGLRLKPPAGEESNVAFALEWNPFEGVDFSGFRNTDHVMLSTGGAVRADSGAGLLRARDTGVEPRRARPGEGWDRSVMRLRHQ